MKYRLDAQHYYLDMLLEPGTEVGDGTSFPWRDKTGHPLDPSVSMTPLDEEAKRAVKAKFGTGLPERDPTKAIPLQGTGSAVKVPPIIAPAKPPLTPQQEHGEMLKASLPPLNNPAPATPKA